MNYNPSVTGYPSITDAQILAVDYKIFEIGRDIEEAKVREEKTGFPMNKEDINQSIRWLTEFIWGMESMSFICPAQREKWFNKLLELKGRYTK